MYVLYNVIMLTGFHTGFFTGGGRSICKGSASVRKHGHTRVSVRAT